MGVNRRMYEVTQPAAALWGVIRRNQSRRPSSSASLGGSHLCREQATCGLLSMLRLTLTWTTEVPATFTASSSSPSPLMTASWQRSIIKEAIFCGSINCLYAFVLFAGFIAALRLDHLSNGSGSETQCGNFGECCHWRRTDTCHTVWTED